MHFHFKFLAGNFGGKFLAGNFWREIFDGKFLAELFLAGSNCRNLQDLTLIMGSLHWHCIKAIMQGAPTCDSHYCTLLGHFGCCNRDRIISINVVPPKVAKASKACHCQV